MGELLLALLAGIEQLGMNASLVKRLVQALASRSSGRAALRMAVAAWQRRSGAASRDAGDPQAALQWAVTRLWHLGTLQWGSGFSMNCVHVELVSGCKATHHGMLPLASALFAVLFCCISLLAPVQCRMQYGLAATLTAEAGRERRNHLRRLHAATTYHPCHECPPSGQDQPDEQL